MGLLLCFSVFYWSYSVVTLVYALGNARRRWITVSGDQHIGGQLQQIHSRIVFWDRLYTLRQADAIICDFPKNAVERAVDGTWEALYQWCSLSVIRGLGTFSFYNPAVVSS